MLSYNELILLDGLGYYSKFSDNPDLSTVGNFVDKALSNNYNTCFNNEIEGLSDEKLGMKKLLNSIKNNSRLSNLKIVFPKDNSYDMTTTSSVCLVDPTTNEVYVIFGGNYCQGTYQYEGKNHGTWADNIIGAFVKDTDEQKRALDFYNEAVVAARNYLVGLDPKYKDEKLDITVSGHSAAGNQAQYVTIAYEGDKKMILADAFQLMVRAFLMLFCQNIVIRFRQELIKLQAFFHH